jgi:hypothetical protein
MEPVDVTLTRYNPIRRVWTDVDLKQWQRVYRRRCRWYFIETHFDPANAKAMVAAMSLHLDYFEALMTKLVAIRQTINTF